jgi:hypothetical protein
VVHNIPTQKPNSITDSDFSGRTPDNTILVKSCMALLPSYRGYFSNKHSTRFVSKEIVSIMTTYKTCLIWIALYLGRCRFVATDSNSAFI